MQFIANRLMSSSWLADRSMPSSTFLVTLIARSNNAMITGKLNTAIRILLLLVLDAIPEMRLREAEKPMDVRINVSRKSGVS